jgi:FkbM family methyltransferase
MDNLGDQLRFSMGVHKMKVWEGLYLPESETHLVDWMKAVKHYVDGKPTYQYNKYAECLKIVENRRTAIDIGGNLGLWSRVMSLDFQNVEAFEPVSEYCEYFVKNAPKANLHNVALSDEEIIVTMACATNGSCGDTAPMVSKRKEKALQDVATSLLDQFGFTDVDFIKVDCEGYEYHVLAGAEQTILESKPVIIVEQKPGKGKKYGYADDEAVKYLQKLGMKIHQVISGDYIMRW